MKCRFANKECKNYDPQGHTCNTYDAENGYCMTYRKLDELHYQDSKNRLKKWLKKLKR